MRLTIIGSVRRLSTSTPAAIHFLRPALSPQPTAWLPSVSSAVAKPSTRYHAKFHICMQRAVREEAGGPACWLRISCVRARALAHRVAQRRRRRLVSADAAAEELHMHAAGATSESA